MSVQVACDDSILLMLVSGKQRVRQYARLNCGLRCCRTTLSCASLIVSDTRAIEVAKKLAFKGFSDCRSLHVDLLLRSLAQ